MLDTIRVPAREVDNLKKLMPAGLRVFSRIAEQWGLSAKDRMTLLGVSPSTYHKWMHDPSRAHPSRDTIERISHVLGVYAALKILLPSVKAANEWIRKPNSAPLFGGNTALSRMLAGNVSDLYIVRQYLDAVRGGWS
jgi:transcriptional regulator with XRE-family HTH domain